MKVVVRFESVEDNQRSSNVCATVDCVKAEADAIDGPQSGIGDQKHDVRLEKFDQAD
jgi:hypothetical protein